MKNFKEMVYGNLFEAKGFKPDFLDLDKDGNKTEPMKQAAKDAKLEEEAHEEAKPSLEEEVKTILDEEGGAADLKKIEEKLLAKNMDISGLKEKLKDMKNVMKHKKGDYIEMSGLKEENPDMMLPAE